MNEHDVEQLLSASLDDWLTALPRYQTKTIRELLDAGKSPEEIAVIWASAPGSSNTAYLGTVQSRFATYQRVREETIKLICGEPSYVNERNELRSLPTMTRVGLVSWMSVALAPHVGMASAVLGPIIVLILYSMKDVALHTLCDEFARLITNDTEGKQGTDPNSAS